MNPHAEIDRIWRTRILPDVRTGRTNLFRPRKEFDPLEQLLDQDTTFRLGYVPFVIAEVAWDYIDSFCEYAAAARTDRLRHLCRRLRALRHSYQDTRGEFLTAAHMKGEQNNMLAFEDEAGAVLSGYYLALPNSIPADVRAAMTTDAIELLQTAHGCTLIMDALHQYNDLISAEASRRVGHPVGNVVMPQTYAAADLMRKIVERVPLLPSFADTHRVAVAHLLRIMRDIRAVDVTITVK